MEESIYYPLTAYYNVIYDNKLDTLILSTSDDLNFSRIPQGSISFHKKDNSKRYRTVKDHRNNSIQQEIITFYEIQRITIPKFRIIFLYSDMNTFILPDISGFIYISVNNKQPIGLDKISYNKFRELDNMELLDYIESCYKINYSKFIADKFGNNIEIKYYFHLLERYDNNHIEYSIDLCDKPKYPNVNPFVSNIIKYLPIVKKLIYHPTSITNLDHEVQEIKNIILPLKLKIIVELEY